MSVPNSPLIPAKAGTQDRSAIGLKADHRRGEAKSSWIPAFAGTSGRGVAIGLVVSAALATSALAEGNPQRGQQVFQDNCSTCHVLTGDAIAAPALAGVVGRKAGTAAFGYSDAMKKSGLMWGDANLNGFLADPNKLVPGTSMYVNFPDPQQRDDVIAYLKTQSPAAH